MLHFILYLYYYFSFTFTSQFFIYRLNVTQSALSF